jgi:hypothetical protein
MSSLWELETLHSRAITELAKLPIPPVEKLLLASKHNIPAWVTPALTEIVMHPTLLTTAEAKKLVAVFDVDILLQLANAREARMDQIVCGSCGSPDIMTRKIVCQACHIGSTTVTHPQETIGPEVLNNIVQTSFQPTLSRWSLPDL